MNTSETPMPYPFICGRCGDQWDELFHPNCRERPELVEGPIGMYHCPDCGAMLLAGFSHPPMCRQCLSRDHPSFDRYREPAP